MAKPGSRLVYGPNYGGSLQKSRVPQSTSFPRTQKGELPEDEPDELMEEEKKPPKAWSTFLQNRRKPVVWQATKGRRHINVNCRKAAQLIRDYLEKDGKVKEPIEPKDKDKKLTKLQRALFEELIKAFEEIVDCQRIPCKSEFNIPGSVRFDEEGTMNRLEYRLQTFVVPSLFFQICDPAISRASPALKVV
jgi:hypothetical protein